MNTIHLVMNKTEAKPRSILVQDLQEGEVVVSATATHTPPSGSALTITPTVATPYVNLILGPFGVPGVHYVKVQAVGDSGSPSKPEIEYIIDVKNY